MVSSSLVKFSKEEHIFHALFGNPTNNNNYYNNYGIIKTGSLISAQVLFSLRAFFGATRIHSYTRMASLIRMQLSDLYTMRSSHFWRVNLWVQLYHRMKTFLLVSRWASNHRCGQHPGASTLSSAPRSNQLGNQGQIMLLV